MPHRHQPQLTPQPRAAPLSSTLATALLNHQITELESRVQSVQLARGDSGDRNGSGSNDHTRFHAGGAAADARAVAPVKFGRIDDDDDEDERAEVLTHDDAPEPSHFVDEADTAWRVVVLDASVMIWALRSVRRLVNRGWEVVVPLESEP